MQVFLKKNKSFTPRRQGAKTQSHASFSEEEEEEFHAKAQRRKGYGV